MEHVVRFPNPPFLAFNDTIEVHQVPVWQDNLCWIVVCLQTGEAAVVDGPQADEVLDYCAQRGLNLTMVLNTHTHGDHVGINRDLQKRGRLSSMRVVGPKLAAADVPGLTQPVDDGDTVQLGAVTGQVLRTEGHLNGHISFVFGDALFCGDTLFTGGCGYLFDGPPERMYESLQRLAALPGDTRVCCGHEYTQDNLRFAWFVEPENTALANRIRAVWEKRAAGGCVVPSTIAEERETNPFLRTDSQQILRCLAEHLPQARVNLPSDVFAATRKLKDMKVHRQMDDSSLPL